MPMLHNPGRIPGAVLRRLLPTHPRFGYPWIRLSDGSVTFRDRGFVSAGSAAELFARHNHEATTIRRLLGGLDANRSLEIGCGFGRLSPIFAENSHRHVGVDINRRALRLARQAYPDCHFAEASATDLPFPDGTFDLAITWTVVQHIPPDRIPQACAEITRVMTPMSTVLMCEETRFAEQPDRRKAHAWHRRIEDYGRLLPSFDLTYAARIDAIDRVPGWVSPGTVMVWRRDG
jgi:SAM-dependent methyltransferase